MAGNVSDYREPLVVRQGAPVLELLRAPVLRFPFCIPLLARGWRVSRSTLYKRPTLYKIQIPKNRPKQRRIVHNHFRTGVQDHLLIIIVDSWTLCVLFMHKLDK